MRGRPTSEGPQSPPDERRWYERPWPQTGLLLLVIAPVGAALVAEHEWVRVTVVAATGVFIGGALLWWHTSRTDKEWDEIGRSIMISVLLAAVIGVPQYYIEKRQKERDFDLSLTLQKDLRSADLHGKDLADIRLRGKHLEHADLRRAVLDRANLIQANLTGAVLDGAQLRDADLRGATLDRASLVRANLTGANLKQARMKHANLGQSHLSNARLDGSKLSGACMARADLRNAFFAGADLSGAVLTSADARETHFESDLRPPKLRTAGLAGLRQGATDWPVGFSYGPQLAGEPTIKLPVEQPLARKGALMRVANVADGDTVRLEAASDRHRQLPSAGRAQLI